MYIPYYTLIRKSARIPVRRWVLSFAYIPTYSFIIEELCIKKGYKLFLYWLELLISKSMRKKKCKFKIGKK
jgi:hypothetical protein